MPSLRTFIAFDTPGSIREEIRELQSELKKSSADIRWEPSEKFHATIKFLGDTDEKKMPDVLARIQTIVKQFPVFAITYASLGCFPNRNNPRVIWLGCQNADGALELLKTRLDVELLPLGFDIEDRRFHPHITLGRVKSSRGLKNLTPMLENLTFQPHHAMIKEILVMKSVLKREGSEYSIIKAIQLNVIQE